MIPTNTEIKRTKTTKTIVEDYYKNLNRLQEALYKCFNESNEILDSLHKKYQDQNGVIWEGELIISKASSTPREEDEYNEHLGHEIAFRKCKLKANLKKKRVVEKLINSVSHLFNSYLEELRELNKYIDMDSSVLTVYENKSLKNEV